MSNTAAQQQVDQERVKQMRLLMAEGGDKAVQHKFGEDATKSAEFREVQRQREAQTRRAREQREKAASEQQAKERSEAKGSPENEKAQEQEKSKEKGQEQSSAKGHDGDTADVPERKSEREKFLAARKEGKAQEQQQSLSR